MDLKVKCTSRDCDWNGKLIDYNDHITNKCCNRVVQCKLGCEQYFMASELSVHEEEECIKRNRSTVLQRCVKKTESIKEEYKRNIDHVQRSLDDMKHKLEGMQKKIVEKLEFKNQELRIGRSYN